MPQTQHPCTQQHSVATCQAFSFYWKEEQLRVLVITTKGPRCTSKFQVINPNSHYLHLTFLRAVFAGSEPVARLLLRSGADIKAQDVDGWNALLHVSWNGDVGLTRLLLGAGANTEA